MSDCSLPNKVIFPRKLSDIEQRIRKKIREKKKSQGLLPVLDEENLEVELAKGKELLSEYIYYNTHDSFNRYHCHLLGCQ